MTRLPIRFALARKAASIERCIARAREEKAAARDFATDFGRQDAAILNVLRACESAIDIANMVVVEEGGIPPDSAREAFDRIRERGILSEADAAALKNMVGFRNVVVHDYRALDLDIAASVIDRELDTLARFAGALLARYDRRAAECPRPPT